MNLKDLATQLLETIGQTDRSVLEKQFGLWDLLSPKKRGRKSLKGAGAVKENELQAARTALMTSENRDQVEQFIDRYFRERFQEDEAHAGNIWNRDSLLEPILSAGANREFSPEEAIAYRLISDVFYGGDNFFEEKLQRCAGTLYCSTQGTRETIEKWHGVVRSILAEGDGFIAWTDLFEKFSADRLISSNEESRLLQKFMRFCADFAVDEKGMVAAAAPGAGGTPGLSKGLQMYLRARKFPAAFEEIVNAYRMPRWILLACLIGRTDMFTLLPTGEFRLLTR